MTLVVQLYAGPGAGKTTLAAQLFAELKGHRVAVELVQEYVKQWAWAGRKVRPFDRGVIYGAQLARESSLYGKVDVVVTDSPCDLGIAYELMYGSEEVARLQARLCQIDRDAIKASGVKFLPIFVDRTKEYDPRGRYEDESQARRVDELVRELVEDRQPVVYNARHNTVAALASYVRGAL